MHWAPRLWKMTVPFHHAAQGPALALSLETSQSLGCTPRSYGGGGWAVRGAGETNGFLGGVGRVEMEQEGPTAHSTLRFEGPGWCGRWQGLSSFG